MAHTHTRLASALENKKRKVIKGFCALCARQGEARPFMSLTLFTCLKRRRRRRLRGRSSWALYKCECVCVCVLGSGRNLEDALHTVPQQAEVEEATSSVRQIQFEISKCF